MILLAFGRFGLIVWGAVMGLSAWCFDWTWAKDRQVAAFRWRLRLEDLMRGRMVPAADRTVAGRMDDGDDG